MITSTRNGVNFECEQIFPVLVLKVYIQIQGVDCNISLFGLRWLKDTTVGVRHV